MKYKLNAFSFDLSEHLRVPITAEQFETTKRDKERCITAVGFEERINLVVDNFFELECDLLNFAQKSLVWPRRSHTDAMQERLLLDRRLMNLLTACRTYIDQSAHIVSGVFGNPSSELEKLSNEKSRLYDSRFGYRFMERLRNYVQHESLAVTDITYSNAAAGGSFELFVVKPMADLQLLKQTGFHFETLSEAIALGDHLDLRGPIREYVASLSDLHVFTRKLLASHVEPAVKSYRAAIDSFSTIAGKKVHNPTLIRIDDSREEMPFEQVTLPNQPLVYYEHLLNRAVRSGELRLKFASGGSIMPEQLPTTIPPKPKALNPKNTRQKKSPLKHREKRDGAGDDS